MVPLNVGGWRAFDVRLGRSIHPVSNQKVERLLTLLQVLLETPRPLTSHDIRGRVPGYSDDDVAFRRTFERDKADLGDIIRHPIRPEPIAGTDPPIEGYRLRAADAFLRDPGLTAEERRAVSVAASAVRLAGIDPTRGTAKVGAESRGAGSTLRAPSTELPAGPAVVTLFQAVAERRVVRFRYRGDERVVHPVRLRFAKGRWYLSAFDTGRDGDRLFRLDRVEGEVETGDADGFAPVAAVAADQLDEPWALGDGPTEPVRVLVDEGRAEAARRAAPGAQAETLPDGTVILTLAVRNRPALRSFVLGFAEDAEVLDPPDVRDEVVRWLTAVEAQDVA